MQEVWGGNEMNDSGEEGTPAASLGAPERGREGRAFGGQRGRRKAPDAERTFHSSVAYLFSSNGRPAGR